ncbi:hypothetical protein G6M89_09075 [Natronolimnobius sp. AArcel1]|uniref:hypothetical protein n=1 Tax=Natronolimnobius sp. AArcel1 TaxID=1679093 RepID=UPI0013EB4F11|nr:hypothetical protein [Natronolimnobius sp. AArcel1]NGM69156.1 hypothetical protein [Natronolimnobius sp. AArcel1]
MKAVITGKSKRVGVKVQDNNGVDHGIEMTFDGEIKYHEQDGYPDDPAERTPNESEWIQQAKEYARHHVWQETDYEPFPVEKNLPGIMRVREAIQELPTDGVRELFADAYNQVDGKDPLPTDLPAPLPPEVGPNDWVVFLIDVYLDENGEIEAVSDIHLRYNDENGDETEQWNHDPFPERKPDARLQLSFDHVPSLDDFKSYLDYHLRCQIRDCYIIAGLEPPEAYKVLGNGQDQITGRYPHPEITIYEPYHKHHPEIPGYELDYDYGMGEYGKIITQLESLTAEDDELREAIDTYRRTGEGKEELIDRFEEHGFSNPEEKLSELVGQT